MTTNKNKLTTSWGAPVGDNQNSMTAGSRGPTLIQDVHLLEKLAHFNRERVPERVVHAKGAGAHGYFEVTNDLSKYTKANFLSEVGKRTPMFIRFSTVAGENLVQPIRFVIRAVLLLNFIRRKETMISSETIHLFSLFAMRLNSLISFIHKNASANTFEKPKCRMGFLVIVS